MKAKLPEYLYGSDLYQVLQDNDEILLQVRDDEDDGFVIPARNLKLEPDICNACDLYHILSTLHFWGCGTLPRTVLDYCLPIKFGKRKVSSYINQFVGHLDGLAHLAKVMEPSSVQDKIRVCIELGDVTLLSVLFDLYIERARKVKAAATRSGHEISLKRCRTRGNRAARTAHSQARYCKRCSLSSQQQVQTWVQMQVPQLPSFWNAQVCMQAALLGSLPCLRFAHEHGCPWDGSACLQACLEQQDDCLLYLIEHDCPWPSCNTTNYKENVSLDDGHQESDYTSAEQESGLLATRIPLGDNSNASSEPFANLIARHVNSVLCLDTALERGCPYSDKICAAAAEGGHLESMQYLHLVRNFSLEPSLYALAARNGHLDCISFAFEQNCPFESSAPCTAAAAGAHLLCLAYLHSHGCAWDEEAFSAAVRADAVECLRYLLEEDCPANESFVCEEAAAAGSGGSLRLLHEQGFPWNASTPAAAVQAGSQPCLLYAIQEDCPTALTLSHVAAKLGQLGCLETIYSSGIAGARCRAVPHLALQARELECLWFTIRHDWPGVETLCADAARSGDLEELQLLRGLGCRWDAATCTAAALSGSLSCLQYAHRHGCPWTADACAAATGYGSLPCLRFLRKHGCPWDVRACASAAASGNLESLRYLHEQGCPWDASVCSVAAGCGKLDVLCYLHEQGCPWDETVLVQAAKGDYLDLVNFLLQSGCPRSAAACSAAAQHCSGTCLKLLCEQGCPWDEGTCLAAACHNCARCLIYARERSCPCSSLVLEEAVRHGSLECVQALHQKTCPDGSSRSDRHHFRSSRSADSRTGKDELCDIAARNGHLHCLIYLYEQGHRWGVRTAALAALNGHLPCLKYALTQGCPRHPKLCELAAHNGHKGCLKYALLYSNNVYVMSCYTFHSNHLCADAARSGDLEELQLLRGLGCRWDAATCTAAALSGSLACLQYAHRHGCPWTADACAAATGYGSLPCLRFLREHGCPWDVRACASAAASGNLESLRYLHEQGCPWDASVCSVAAGCGKLDVLCYLHEQGCPWDTSTVTSAAAGKNIACMKYAYENGCAVDAHGLAAEEERIRMALADLTECGGSLEEEAEYSECLDMLRLIVTNVAERREE